MVEISKKELLEITGISYGQLYRWKRQGLIPEDWFIKKASFTGQETYFPKDRILERIDKILELKDIKSLEEISEIINGNALDSSITKEDIRKRNIYMNAEVIDLLDDKDIHMTGLLVMKIIDNVVSKYQGIKNLEAFKSFLLEEGNNLANKYKYILIIIVENEIKAYLLKEEIEGLFNDYDTMILNLELLFNNMKLIFI